MPETITKDCILHNFTSWIVESTPFFPRFEPDDSEDDRFKIEFNKGYVYDYAKGGEKMPVVAGGDFTVSLGEAKSFKIKLTIDNASGVISLAEIIDGTGEELSETEMYTNLKNLSNIAGVEYGESKIILLDLMDIQGPNLKEFHVRENLHLWFRGFHQKGDTGHAPLKQSPSERANDIIEFREILEDPREDNEIEIATVGDSITFYVPPSSSETGTDPHITEVVASTQADNTITVTSATTSSGIKYTLYVPPCSCSGSSS